MRRSSGQARYFGSPRPSCRTSRIARQTSRPMKSASVSGPIGWFMPSFITVSIDSAVPTPSMTREDRFVDHRHQDAIGDEAGVVGCFDCRLVEPHAQLGGHQHRIRRRRLAANQLHQRHQRHRVHEVHAQDAVGTVGSRAERRDRDRRRVRGQDHVGPRQLIEPREERLLRLAILEDGLDDVVAVGESVGVGCRREPGERCVTLGRREAALLDELSKAFLDRCLGSIERARCGVDEPDLEPCLREHLGNTVAHRACANHTYPRMATPTNCTGAGSESRPGDRQATEPGTSRAPRRSTRPRPD